MPTQSILIEQSVYDNLKSLYAAGYCSSITDAANEVMAAMFKNNYAIKFNGVEKSINLFLIENPYVRNDFNKLGAKGKFEKKFVLNFNSIKDKALKRAVYNFMKECINFIERKYNSPARIGTLENIGIYYPDASDNNWLAVYIDVKYIPIINPRVSISRFLRLNNKKSYVNDNTNLLWNEIKNFYAATSYGENDVYNLDENEIEELTEHIKIS